MRKGSSSGLEDDYLWPRWYCAAERIFANIVQSVPQRERPQEVRAKAEGRHSQGGGQAMSIADKRNDTLQH
jgi:hypothetical protein